MGFVFAAVFLWLARPTWRTMVASLVLVLPGLWLRGYASGYVKKNAELATTGPYAYTRNPLYLGSMLIAFGFAAAAARWEILVLLAALFAAIYIPTIQSEEAYLREHFAGFDAYARAVPRLIPRWSAAGSPAAGADAAADGPAGALAGGLSGGFSKALYLRHREYNSAMGAVCLYLALAARLLYFSR
jgi:hypothetical protein